MEFRRIAFGLTREWLLASNCPARSSNRLSLKSRRMRSAECGDSSSDLVCCPYSSRASQAWSTRTLRSARCWAVTSSTGRGCATQRTGSRSSYASFSNRTIVSVGSIMRRSLAPLGHRRDRKLRFVRRLFQGQQATPAVGIQVHALHEHQQLATLVHRLLDVAPALLHEVPA